jgi:hypothetical protein
MAELITALEHNGNNMYHLLYYSEIAVCSSEAPAFRHSRPCEDLRIPLCYVHTCVSR